MDTLTKKDEKNARFRARVDAQRAERRRLSDEDKERWKTAADQCKCDFRHGVNGVIHQEGVPADYYIREDELPINRDSGLTECDPEESNGYLRDSAKVRARSNEEFAFQELMRQSKDAERARQRRADRFRISGNVYTVG